MVLCFFCFFLDCVVGCVDDVVVLLDEVGNRDDDKDEDAGEEMDGFDNEPEEEGCDNDVDRGKIVVVNCTATVEGTCCTFSRPFLYCWTLICSSRSEDCENVKQAALIAWGAVKFGLVLLRLAACFVISVRAALLFDMFGKSLT